MGITVDLKADGSALINRYEKNQQIFLHRSSWVQLITLKDSIQRSLHDKTEERWSIGNNVYVLTSLYNDDVFLHIRVWWKDQPTKQGVSMAMHEWSHLYSFLQFDDDEATLGVSILKDMLRDAVGKFIKKNCEGCKHDLPSQTDHACLMDASLTAHGCIDNIFHQLNICEFIARLAKMGQAKKIIVKKPYDTFHLIRTLKENELKASTLSSFDRDC